ncbi:putative adhesion molecule [Tieghemostelium lacteum]|uniref:Putative adhesion molecule n=1 Tax=Tieghemostelium lacteum TaxID=361077 RepID=A0A152A5F2_TIELA|nr:putative adhesion molecule [Tieghemostelium lacteum]|eukprot:KYR01335.1 putative adhesion molecule [Tieghemostelium lacteum]
MATKGSILIYLKPNFEGDYVYEMRVPGRYKNTAATIKSVKIGPKTKLKISEPNGGRLYEMTSGEHGDINIPYNSIMQCVDISFKFSIDIKFNHTISGKPANEYGLTIKPLHFDNTGVITSGATDYVGVQIPQLNPPDSLIVSQISVRENPWPHQIVSNGSIYFKYNPTSEDITFEMTEGFPANMTIVKDDIWGFTFTLKSLMKMD